MEEKYWKQFENSGRIGEAVFTDGTGARDDVPSAGGTD